MFCFTPDKERGAIVATLQKMLVHMRKIPIERLPAKAGRLLFRLKVGLRLKPPEAAPAEEPA